MTDDIVIEFRGINKSYDGKTYAVRDLDLNVNRGEFLSLLGASGSGKTTTLMMVAGFESPSSGSIVMNGRPLDSLPAWRRNIGMVFQSYALFPHMTVAQNIAFPLRQRRRGDAAIAQRVQEMLALVKLDGAESRYPRELSGGQQQRVALARALVFEPELVLMDEPLGALDKRLREHMQIEIKKIHERLGVTVIYVTHDQDEALAMSDRVAVFADGRLRQISGPSGLYERPDDAVVANFVGDNNCLEGVVQKQVGDMYTVRLQDEINCNVSSNVELKSGDKVRVFIRPERVSIDHKAIGRETTTKAVIEAILYLGDHARISLRSDGGISLAAKIMNGAEGLHLRVGDRIAFSWRDEDARAFLSDDAVLKRAD